MQMDREIFFDFCPVTGEPLSLPRVYYVVTVADELTDVVLKACRTMLRGTRSRRRRFVRWTETEFIFGGLEDVALMRLAAPNDL